MKREQREVYLALVNEVDWMLCGFCKFAVSYSCDMGHECHHPLADKSFGFDREVEKAGEMGDCWGFRPKLEIPLIADIVGITLAEGWDGGVSWWQDGDVLKISGIRRR